jgi:mitochondrial splicing suppressor protein 51
LKKAEKRKGILPSWWSEEKREACITQGDQGDGSSSLHGAVEKSDIQEHYGNSMAPMQLRMLAEKIVGSNVMSY